MRFNEDMLDALTLVSFMIGVANYNENLTQSDKDDIMKSLDQQTKDILTQIEAQLKEQNEMLEEIITELRKGKNESGI